VSADDGDDEKDPDDVGADVVLPPAATAGDRAESTDDADDAGPDAVKAALNRARAAARARGLRPGSPAPPSARAAFEQRRNRERDAGVRSGAGPDARDPQLVGSNIDRLVAERGWHTPVAVGGVLGRWPAVVGADVAEHCTPESFEEGVLVVRADSTAWATQVRLLVPALMRRLAEEVGESTVTKVVVHGPTAPSWKRGPRVAPGSQGPRDTYG
jgi:predicted nucleic acid-binding Zn ribbon protein